MAQVRYKVELYQKDVHFPKQERDANSSSLLKSWFATSPWPEVSRQLEGRDVTVGVWCKIRTDPKDPDSPSSAMNNPQGVIDKLYYSSLSSGDIRLLEVQPGPVAGTVRGNLLVASLDACPDYHALSYVWGDSSCTEIIECDGEYLKISYNAATAILHHRSPIRSTLLWIDSICINQTDHDEKSSQVQLMPQIYRNASEVDIWLKEGTGSSGLGMDILDHFIGSGMGSHNSLPWNQRAPQLLQEGLRDVMEREWWSRGWTVQEMALSSRTRITCGQRKISWIARPDRIHEIIRNINLAEISHGWNEAGLTPIPLQPLLNLLREQLQQIGPSDHSQPTDIVDVMHSFREKHFQDPRDKIYAMLGLASDVKIQPDYSLNVEETWEIFLEAVGKGHDVDRLRSSRTSAEELGGEILRLPEKRLLVNPRQWFGHR